MQSIKTLPRLAYAAPQRAARVAVRPIALKQLSVGQQQVGIQQQLRFEASRDVACAADAGSIVPEAEEITGIEKLADKLATMFPLWVAIGAVVGITTPTAVTWFSSTLFTVALGFLMLAMGLTLTFNDFRECLKRPGPILLGYFGQYGVKPMLGYVISKALQLPDALAVGLILVSCCPGGQASNVATFIAHGDVALSVLMTTASTIGAIVMTPLLTQVLAGATGACCHPLRCCCCC